MYNEFGYYRAYTINDTVCLLETENNDQTDAYCVEQTFDRVRLPYGLNYSQDEHYND